MTFCKTHNDRIVDLVGIATGQGGIRFNYNVVCEAVVDNLLLL